MSIERYTGFPIGGYRPGGGRPSARVERISHARSMLKTGDEDAARAMCKPDEWEVVQAGIGEE